ncbi:MAG: hypothetical protein ACREUR_04665 [Nitrosospira sp.]
MKDGFRGLVPRDLPEWYYDAEMARCRRVNLARPDIGPVMTVAGFVPPAIEWFANMIIRRRDAPMKMICVAS